MPFANADSFKTYKVIRYPQNLLQRNSTRSRQYKTICNDFFKSKSYLT